MNYLAHILLSGDDELRLVGNFVGDFVKGQQWRAYPTAVQHGILLHRFIDQFTDTHPIVSQSMSRLKPTLGRFSGIAVDVLYDHCLAHHFGQFSPLTLPAFAQQTYQILDSHWDILPERVQELLPYMKRENWLAHYASLSGIQKALAGISRRLRHVTDLTQAIPLFEASFPHFEAEFLAFFAELQAAVVEETARLRKEIADETETTETAIL